MHAALNLLSRVIKHVKQHNEIRINVTGHPPNSVMITLAYSAGIASYVRLSSSATQIMSKLHCQACEFQARQQPGLRVSPSDRGCMSGGRQSSLSIADRGEHMMSFST